MWPENDKQAKYICEFLLITLHLKRKYIIKVNVNILVKIQ